MAFHAARLGAEVVLTRTVFGRYMVAIGTNEQAVEIMALTRYASTTPRTLLTPAANWSQAFGPTTLAATDSINLYMMSDNTTLALESQRQKRLRSASRRGEDGSPIDA